ncbi:OmpA family protein [Pyruvatibacter sp.]|uniref:OmpA family protein n=1 Tax=Pyruvatibacter sp. TaxID=1981328 RepID=UPI0032EC25C1
MKPLLSALTVAAVLGGVFIGASGYGHAADIADAQDHPVISRYPGSEIKWYDVQAFAPYFIATGPVTGYRKIDDWQETQGRLTRIYYELSGEKTHTEVYANYKKALTDAGFTFAAQGLFANSEQSAEIGSRKWLPVHFARNDLPPVGIRLMQGSSTSGGSAFLAASKERAAGVVYVVIAVTQYSEDIVATMIDVIEEDTVETDLVTVDAEAMGDDIDEYGRVTLDGLYFDHDKATLTAASKPALDEIAKFLKQRGSMNFYVVGHTDAVGSFDYNTSLAKRRAQTVASTLNNDYDIATQRLEPHGVGPLVPVFSNSSEGGRAKNRRVELVERP